MDVNAGDGETPLYWPEVVAAACLDGILMHEEGKVLRASARLARMLGYVPEEMEGMNGWDLTVPGDRARLGEHLRSGSEEALRGTALRRDGSRFPVEIRGRVVRHAGREVRVAVVRDISERVEFEAELARRERELRSITNHVPDVITRYDREHRVCFMSAAVESITGLPPDAFLGRRMRELGFPPDLIATWEARTERVFETGQADELRFEFPGPDGELRFFHTRVVPEPGEDGRVETVLTATRDVTDQVRVHDALQAREARFRALVEHAADLIAIHDADGTSRYASPAHLRVLGLAPAHLEGRSCFDLVHPSDTPRLRALFQRAMTVPGPTQPRNVRFRRVDGGYCTLAVQLTDMRAERSVGGIIANSRDVTEELRLHERLQQAQKMEALGLLAGGVAHDFNNTLMSVSGFAQMILQELPPGAPHRPDVEEIHRAAERGTAVTRQLLAFSRRQELETVAIDLSSVVRRLDSMLRPLMPRSIDLVLSLSDEAAVIRAVEGQVEQILLNLCVNARDAMPGGGTLRIEVAKAGRPGEPRVVVRVGDTGTGMAPEVRARAFEPFFTTKGPSQGTGLGLATVYGLVRQFGGTVDVESELGAGTTFTLTFPAAEAAGPAGVGEGSERGGADLTGVRVLVVEDEAPLRSLCRRILTGAGGAVTVAGDGVEALERFDAEGPFDVVLTDATMPRMGGLELAERLLRAHPGVPVVLMSGYAELANPAEGLGAAFAAFIQKPFPADRLPVAVAAVLNGGGG